MKLNLFKNRIANKIEIVGKEVQSLINNELEKANFEPSELSPLNQAGMKDGLKIIQEYTAAGEYGVAFDHILYMIHETDILISEDSSTLITGLSKKMNISIEHITR